jgi:beta-hydroxylase
MATTDISPPTASEDEPALDRCHRDHRLNRPTTVGGRILLRLQGWLEHGVARVSQHGDPPIYDPAWFPWVADLEHGWPTIRAELDHVLAYRDRMPSFHQILKEVSTITTDDQWKTFFLAGIGMDCSKNARSCPQTMRLLARIPGMKTAFFSILSPHKHIPAHRGAYNGILRYHLGLLVPEPRERCRIRIGNTVRHWTEGQSLIFDDTYNHEVWNDTDGHRVVLFVDFARPLRPPFHRINEAFLDIGRMAPFLREAGARHKTWERTFYPS